MSREPAKTSACNLAEAPLLCEILQQLEAAGALANTWLERRWHTVKRRVEAAHTADHGTLHL